MINTETDAVILQKIVIDYLNPSIPVDQSDAQRCERVISPVCMGKTFDCFLMASFTAQCNLWIKIQMIFVLD